MKLYLIPAYKETIRNQGYKNIIKAAETAGYSVEVLDLQLQGSEYKNVIKKGVDIITKEKEKAILGFSTGALIAYSISAEINFKKAFFCSISPFLESDIPKSDALYRAIFGKKTVKSLKAARYGISKAEQGFYFFGDKEGRKLPKRTKQLCKISNGQLVVITNNDHELNAAYLKEITHRL